MKTTVYLGPELAAYGFANDHPFSPKRHDAFAQAFQCKAFFSEVNLRAPVLASMQQIEMFHTPAYIERVRRLSKIGQGYLDQGDTPAFAGVYEAAAAVVGSVLDGIDYILEHSPRGAFIPIAGLHHARRDSAAGFCVFNDCGVAIEYLRREHHIQRVAYIDIDAHHGDGVFYSFVNDPELIFVDFHEDGRILYPGTGHVYETGEGLAKGRKLNIPMPPQADDQLLEKLWENAEAFIRRFEPQFFLLQCGADSVAGDPITHMAYSSQSHYFVTRRLVKLAEEFAQGRILAMGGGGYHLQNIADAWCAVVQAMVETDVETG